MTAQKPQKYFPYMGIEFHLAESVKTHRTEPDVSQHHFEASGMFQEAQNESDLDLKKIKIQKYKQYCKEKKIKAFSLASKAGV
jgi:hypothetical protein